MKRLDAINHRGLKDFHYQGIVGRVKKNGKPIPSWKAT